MANESQDSFRLLKDEESNNLLEKGHDEIQIARDSRFRQQSRCRHRLHLIALYASNLILLSTLLWTYWAKVDSCKPDALGQ